MNVIITDVRYRMSLPVIRSLGKAGARITCTERISTPDKAALGFKSKYTHAKAHLPCAEDGQSFMSALISLADGTCPVVIPVGIDSLLTLCDYPAEAQSFFKTALPPKPSIELANDKYSLVKQAVSVGVPCPGTTTLRPGETVEDMAARVSYPAVIKYRAGELLHLDAKDRYAIVDTPEELCKTFEKMHALQEFPLVQEYVSGEGFGVSVVMDKEHNPLKVFCHRRLREYPISGGPSCLCESTWDQALAEHAVALLRSLNWVGVAMVEFKGTPESGYKLMEINPRLWGSLALAPIAGCDMPLALAQAACGELAGDKPIAPDYKLGKRMRFRIQDTLAFPGYLKKAKNKPLFALKYILSLIDPRTKDGVFCLSDPKPGFAYLKNAFGKRNKIAR